MVTTVGTASDIIDMLNDLIQLDYDAIQAYEAAIGRIDNSEHQRQLTGFRDDHVRHTQELGRVVSELGAEPATSASMTDECAIMLEGAFGGVVVLLGVLVGHPLGVLARDLFRHESLYSVGVGPVDVAE